MYSLTQKLIAEFFGTFAVVFFAAGALCADQYLRSSGQGSITILGLAFAYGLTVGIMVTAIGHISGGHLNPAVTVAFWVSRRLSTLQTILYSAAQLLGAIAAPIVTVFLLDAS